MKRKKAYKKPRGLPPGVESLLRLSPPGTVITAPKNYCRKKHADPDLEQPFDFTNAQYLMRATASRLGDSRISGPDHAEMWVAFTTLADLISRRAERYIFPAGATDQDRKRFAEVLAHSYERGFFLALMRYRDDLKNVPEAAAMLESQRRFSAKGAAARRAQAEPNRKAICKRFREMRKTTPKKTVRYLRIAEEFGMSDRHVQRIVTEEGID